MSGEDRVERDLHGLAFGLGLLGGEDDSTLVQVVGGEICCVSDTEACVGSQKD
jgi:hypothetical protein